MHRLQSWITQKSHFSVWSAISCVSLVHTDLCGFHDEPSVHAKRRQAIILRTSPEDRRAHFGWKICFGSQVSSVLWFRELHLNVSHFHFRCIPALIGRRGSSVCFPPEPLLASIVKSLCWCFISPQHSGTEYGNIVESKLQNLCWKSFSANGILRW